MTRSASLEATLLRIWREVLGNDDVTVRDSFFDVGDYTHAAFVGGMFWPAWSDNSNSTGDNPDGTLHQFDLYTAKIPIS